MSERAKAGDPRCPARAPDARNEVIAGLAARTDAVIVPTPVRELEHQIASLEAAAKIADPASCKARGMSWDNDGQIIDPRQDWEQAIKASGCQAQQREREVPSAG